jgi:hypothetical protein
MTDKMHFITKLSVSGVSNKHKSILSVTSLTDEIKLELIELNNQAIGKFIKDAFSPCSNNDIITIITNLLSNRDYMRELRDKFPGSQPYR